MAVRSVAAVKGVSLSRRHYPGRLARDMAAFRAVLLLFLCRLPLASSCIPTVTPDDMYEDEMEATTSVLLTTVLDMTAETTSQATAEPTTTTSTTSTTTTTTTTTTTGMCPPSWVLNPAINFCYLLVPASPGTVNDAKCNAVVAGATLASIHNADENAFIISYIVGAPTNFVFMGGYSPTGMPGSWYWTDGTTYGYENWDTNPVPGLNCMAMSANPSFPGQLGRWQSTSCNSDMYAPLCMIAAT